MPGTEGGALSAALSMGMFVLCYRAACGELFNSGFQHSNWNLWNGNAHGATARRWARCALIVSFFPPLQHIELKCNSESGVIASGCNDPRGTYIY